MPTIGPGSASVATTATLDATALAALEQTSTQGLSSEQSSLTAGSLNADLVPSTDVSSYKWFSIQVVGTWSGTLTVQGSNDNTNWVSVVVNSVASTVATGSGNITANGISHGAISFRFLRIRMTSYVSGTATGVAELYTFAAGPNVLNVIAGQNGTWTVQPGNTANTTPWLVQPRFATMTNLAANGTTTVKSGAGILHSISINTKGVTNTATVYDNTAGSGTKIATIDTTLSQDTLVYDGAFATGLTVVLGGGTPADLTVVTS